MKHKPSICTLPRYWLTILISIILFLTIITSYIYSQESVRIRERVEIDVSEKMGRGTQWSDPQAVLTYVVPFNSIVRVTIYAYLIRVSDDPMLIVNGRIVIPSLIKQWPKRDILIGEYRHGEVMTFKLVRAEGGIWAGSGREAQFVYKPDCYCGYWMSYRDNTCRTEIGYSCYVDLVVDFINTTTEKHLEGDWAGFGVTHGKAIVLNSKYTERCWEYTGGGGSYSLPAGTTFTYSITCGREYAVLIDPQSGAV